jgi:peroxiredoxin
LVPAEGGEKVPGFTLPTDDRENRVSLDDYTKDGPVALFVCPLDTVLRDLERAL